MFSLPVLQCSYQILWLLLSIQIFLPSASDLLLWLVCLVFPVTMSSLRVMSLSVFLFLFDSPCPLFGLSSFASPLSRYVRLGPTVSPSSCGSLVTLRVHIVCIVPRRVVCVASVKSGISCLSVPGRRFHVPVHVSCLRFPVHPVFRVMNSGFSCFSQLRFCQVSCCVSFVCCSVFQPSIKARFQFKLSSVSGVFIWVHSPLDTYCNL